MIILPSGTPLLISGQKLNHSGYFSDNFQRTDSFGHAPLGMGWQDLGELFPANYDIARIHNGAVTSGDPYWREKHGATMAPNDDWEHYNEYPGTAVGGLGGAIRNVGDGIYNYDVSARIGGQLSGETHLGPEAEGTPIVGVNVDSPHLGYGAWLVNVRFGGVDTFIFMIGYVGNPPEDFGITHTAPVSHTQGQEREVTLKYRGTGFTVWLDGVQVTNVSTYPGGVSIGAGLIPVPAAHQNKSWAGFEYDIHITAPEDMTTVSPIRSYSHRIIN